MCKGWLKQLNKHYMNPLKYVNQVLNLTKLGIFVSNYIKNINYRKVAAENGFVVCELFTGHGIGNLLHMPPTIMHHCNKFHTT